MTHICNFLFQSARGMTFHLAVVDEAGFAGAALKVIFPVIADEKSKIICTTSVNAKEEKSCLLYNLSKIDNYPIYSVSLACEKHLNKIALTEEATTCPCYILAAPPARSGDYVLKKTMNILYDNSYSEEMLGGGTRQIGQKYNNNAARFSALDTFEFEGREDSVRLTSQDDCLVAYIDPAFSDSQEASKNGMCVVSTFNNRIILVGADEYGHRDYSTEAVDNVAAVFVELVVKIITNHPHCQFQSLNVVIERNYASVFAWPLSQTISLQLKERIPNLRVYFLHTRLRDNIFKVGYYLGYEKANIFDTIASLFNDGMIGCSTVIFSTNISDPLSVLLQQLQFLQSKGKNDDIAVSFIMSCYFLLNIHNEAFLNGIKYKWVS